jgi:Flp pilus assembly protein TadG
MTDTMQATKRSRFLKRLFQDQSGNVLAMTAAAILPMIAVIGGAVDMSRIYMTKARLQAACDAGTLAGRKAMSTLAYTTAARARADAMFNFNFDSTDYNANGTVFNHSADAQGTITATASTNLPTVLMRIFGKTTTAISVNCGADLQIPNIDIVFVLDVTGSMDQSINNVRKIASLKTAAKNFYDTIKTAMAGNTRSQVRYGFVPYSQAVKGTELFVASPDASKGQLPLSHITDNMAVESRVANFNTPIPAAGSWVVDSSATPTQFTQIFNKDTPDSLKPDTAVSSTGTKISNNDCDDYGGNDAFNILGINVDVFFPVRTSYPGEGNGDSILYKAEGSSTWQASVPTTGTYYTAATFSRVSNTWSDNNGASTGDYKTCTRRVTHTRYVKQPAGFKFTNWTYKPVTYNVNQYKQGNALSYVSAIDPNYTVTTSGSYNPVQLRQLPNQGGLTSSNTTWNGCLEERTTTAVSTFSPIPAAAKDLDFLAGGTTDELRWRPILQNLTYDRGRVAEETTTSNRSVPDHSCPSVSMRNLKSYAGTAGEAEFDTYIDSLQADGYTYLDVGMVWGLRLISSQGMFASRNLTGPNGSQISRHIIFLTDGEPVSQPDTYSSYGVEQMSKRITGTLTDPAATLHARRFQALCDAQRGAISIWAIAFGTSVTGNLSSCADPDRAFQADNATQLDNAFKNIANEIADLRLIK